MSEPALKQLLRAAGAGGVITDAEQMLPYLRERRDRYQGRALAVVRPATPDAVSQVVQAAGAAGLGIVPQGGNTGLVGGQIPFDARRQVVLSLERLRRIRKVDALDNTLVAEAGCVLAAVHEAAAAAERLFPLRLASEGTAQIGGLLSTNAGGSAVLRHGSMRTLALGLEVVLADGRIWHGLRALRKDNTGYDLKQLFLGAEGTLGIITAAVLRLQPRPAAVATAFAGVCGPRRAQELLALAQERSAGGVSCFEIMSQQGLELVLRHGVRLRCPVAADAPWFVLLELSSGGTQEAADAVLQDILAQALERSVIDTGAIAASLAQAGDFRRLREEMSEAQRREGASIKHDVCVPVSAVPEFLERATAAVERLLPGVRPVPFGHAGDGNIHFNLSPPADMDPAAFLDLRGRFHEAVHDIVSGMDGSISAEHGIGVALRDENARRKSAVERDLARRLKRALDPENILNPGKLVPEN